MAAGNRVAAASDHRHVLSCDEVREAISAQLDDESPGCSPAVLDEHLAGCADCQAWREQAHRVTRRVRVTPAGLTPGDDEALLAVVLAERARVRTTRRRRLTLRAGLALVALAQLVLTGLLLGLDHGGMAGMSGMQHMDHELIAFNAALAVGFGFAALRPGRARGMVPIAGIVALAIVAAALIDIIDGSIGTLHETQHVLLVVGWLLLWAVARAEGEPGTPSGERVSAPEGVSADSPPAPRFQPLRAVRPDPPAARHIPGKVAALILLAGVVGVLAIGERPASAHAVLESTSPVDGGVVNTAPRQVSLGFGEPVTVESDSLRVFDDHLHRVDSGKPIGNGPNVHVALRSGLHAGTYTVTWRVVSADSHPVSGGFTFSIGHPSTVAGTVSGESGGSRLVGILLGAGRLLAYAGVVLGLGTVAVLFAFWPAGRTERRVRLLVWSGLALLAVGTAIGLLLEGPYGAGRGITHVFDGSLLADTFGARYGAALSVRVGLLVVIGFLLAAALRRPLYWILAALGAADIGVLVTFGLAGHADTGNQVPLTMFSDVVHLAAMGCWLGGLVLVVVCLTRRTAELGVVLPRFSQLAFGAVLAIVVSGTYQAWRNVGSWSALTDTVYGRLLVAKIACVVVLLGLGNAARRWVTRQYVTAGQTRRPARISARAPQTVPAGGPDAPPALQPPTETEPPPHQLRALRRGLAGEVVIGVAVLVLTTILVNTAQAKETQPVGPGSNSASYSTSAQTQQTRVQLTVKPARPGAVSLSLQVRRPGGGPLPVQKVTASLSLPAADIGPLPVTFRVPKNGPITGQAELARAGDWFLDVTVQTSPIDATAFRLAVPIH